MGPFKAAVIAGATAATAARALLGPWLDLAIRVWIAQAFLTAQVSDAMLSTSLAAPLHAAWFSGMLQRVAGTDLGALVQAVCPLLLVVGLLSRLAASALIVQIWWIAMPFGAHDAGLFWTALLLRVAVLGPGPLALERLMRRGANSNALPGAASLGRLRSRVSRLQPVFLLGLRLWLAAAPIGETLAHLSVTTAMQPGAAAWLPHVPTMVATIPPALALLAGLLLASGTFTRGAALGLLALVPLGEIAGTEDVRLFWALVLLAVALDGPGLLSVDGALLRWARRRTIAPVSAALPHIVVVGGGFGGLATVRGLRRAACRVTLVDRRNHHVFQPLLYQVATAGLAPSDVATPMRAMLRRQPNVRVMLGDVVGVDPSNKSVLLGGSRLAYDWLVVATGARHSYFGRDEWSAFAPGLKSIEDSTAIRRRLLLAFEEAENAQSDAAQQAWLTFVIVGGGPTGVELAGAIVELARHGLDEEFREIDPASARVLLIQSGPRLLPAFPEALSREAERALRRLGVDVQLGRRVEQVDAEGVTISGVAVASRTVLWAAGVMASPAARWLGVTGDRAGRVPVEPDLSVAGLEDVFVIGDTALCHAWAGKEVPGLAPAAKQGGAYVARVIRARLAGRREPGPFRYRHLGSLATIGRQAAVADFGFLQVRGTLAWWLWGAAHIAFLVGGRSRVIVLVQWLWAYLTFQRSTRLITGGASDSA